MIYYLLDSERQLLKIGCSKNPIARLKVLRRRRPDMVLLACEPGSFLRERQQHATFATQRMDSEWFTYAGPLKTYVEDLAVRFLGRDEAVTARAHVEVAALPAGDGVRVIGRHVFGWVDEFAARLIYCGAIPVRMTIERDSKKWCWNCKTVILVPKVEVPTNS